MSLLGELLYPGELLLAADALEEALADLKGQILFVLRTVCFTSSALPADWNIGAFRSGFTGG